MLKLRIIVVSNLLKPKSSCCYLLRSDDHKSEKLKNTNTYTEKTTQHLQGVNGRTEERRRRGDYTRFRVLTVELKGGPFIHREYQVSLNSATNTILHPK